MIHGRRGQKQSNQERARRVSSHMRELKSTSARPKSRRREVTYLRFKRMCCFLRLKNRCERLIFCSDPFWFGPSKHIFLPQTHIHLHTHVRTHTHPSFPGNGVECSTEAEGTELEQVWCDIPVGARDAFHSHVFGPSAHLHMRSLTHV